MAYEGYWKDNLPDGKGYSYSSQNRPIMMEYIQGISILLAPESKWILKQKLISHIKFTC